MERGSRGVMLTGAGQAPRKHAHVLLRDLDRVREAVRAEAGGPVRGSVTSGLPTTVAMALTLLLLAMREGHPEVALLLVESQSGHLLEWLRQGRLTWRCCSTPGRRGGRDDARAPRRDTAGRGAALRQPGGGGDRRGAGDRLDGDSGAAGAAAGVRARVPAPARRLCRPGRPWLEGGGRGRRAAARQARRGGGAGAHRSSGPREPTTNCSNFVLEGAPPPMLLHCTAPHPVASDT